MILNCCYLFQVGLYYLIKQYNAIYLLDPIFFLEVDILPNTLEYIVFYPCLNVNNVFNNNVLPTVLIIRI